MKQVSIQRLAGPLVILLLTLPLAAQPVAELGQLQDQSSIGTPLTFNVWLDERRMGTHSYHFEQKDEDLIVTSEANFAVKLVFVTVFSYEHEAVETWRGNCLTRLRSNTVTDGEKESIDLEIPSDDCAGTYAYWDKTRLQRSVLTNAQTGETEPASWTDLGAVSLPVIGKRRKVTRRVKDGEGGLESDVQGVKVTTPSATFMLFYDKNNHLLMMQTDNDGRTITYLSDALKVK